MTKWITSTDSKAAVADAKREARGRLQKQSNELVVARRERLQYKLDAARARQKNGRLEKENQALKEKLAHHTSLWSKSKEGVSNWDLGDPPPHPEARRAHSWEVLDGVVRSDSRTRAVTGLRMERFDFLYQRFLGMAKRNRHGTAPLFFEATRRSSCAGPRLLLPLRHVLVVALNALRTNQSQRYLAAVFGTSQPTINRYLAFAYPILEAILPTPDRITVKLRNTTWLAEYKQLVTGHGRGVIIIDGSQSERDRPQDRHERDLSASGRYKMHSFLNLVCANKAGALLWLSPTLYGSENEFEVLKTYEPDFGMWTEKLRAEYVDPSERFTIPVDLGYVGIQKLYPAQRTLIGFKRLPGKELTPEEVEWNAYVSKRRIAVEHGIGWAKKYEKIRAPFRGTNKKFRKVLNLACGLANLNTLWPIMKKGSWVGSPL